MVTVCKVKQCPFNSGMGFCRNKVLSITENGLCGHIYDKRGQLKQNWQERIDEEMKEQLIIIDVAENG